MYKLAQRQYAYLIVYYRGIDDDHNLPCVFEIFGSNKVHPAGNQQPHKFNHVIARIVNNKDSWWTHGF